ncbi:MAG TPA: hypothetical protein VN843_17995 [Anaerolineales bacterium]|nr:hypothetical protein [Anaerolineales bacterium]
MKNRPLLFILVAILGTAFLLPNFYRNKWGVVEAVRYEDWQTRYDRLVIARLVKTRQDGFLSASGLLGLGDVQEWSYLNRTNKRQFNAYLNGDNFKTYFVYKSNPGFQGVLYGIFDQLPFATQSMKLKLFRGFTALVSALVFGIIVLVSIREFGWLSGVLILLFAAFSAWTILPAGSIFYNYWSFYLPPLLTTYLLAEAENKSKFESKKIYSVIFITVLMKIVLSGFDFVTTVLVMTTVPFIFFSIYNKWSWKLLFERLIKTGLILLAATLTGLLILSLQIVTYAGDLESAGSHIFDRLAIYTIENPAIFEEVDASAEASTLAVTAKYFIIPALAIHFQRTTVQILYWHLVLVFLLLTMIFFLKHRFTDQVFPNRGIALVGATWYSLLAPLSWFVIFKKHSFIHTHVNPIVWQMPFTILGLALCGFVIMELFKRKVA